MYKRLLSFTLSWIAISFLAGCNLPANTAPAAETGLPAPEYTAAAETIAAQLTPVAQTATSAPQATLTLTPTVLESTATPEPTATATPTQTPTPTEIPEIIFFDNFSDTSGWYTFEDDRFGFKYTADGYHIYNNIKMGLIWSIREQEYSTVAVEVDGTRISGAEDSYFGVVCKFSNDGDNYYALVIGDNGFYGLGLMEDGEYEFLASGIDDSEIIKNDAGETNRIRGICNGDHYMIYANGELLLEAWDNTLETGIVGLVVGNQRTSSAAEFRFNDFAITWP